MLPVQSVAASAAVQLCVCSCFNTFWNRRLLRAAAKGPHAASERSAKTLTPCCVCARDICKNTNRRSAAIVGSSGEAMAFSLARAARPAEADVKPLPNKRPRCSDLVVQGPLPPQPKRQTPTADVEVCIYKFTDDAASVWDGVKEASVPLYQVQLRQDALNSICVNLYDKFNSFLKTQDGVPQTLVELQKQALIKLVTTDGKDPDNIGFQRWRNAFYVAGESTALLNCI